VYNESPGASKKHLNEPESVVALKKRVCRGWDFVPLSKQIEENSKKKQLLKGRVAYRLYCYSLP
jgi:hypothetical protein